MRNSGTDIQRFTAGPVHRRVKWTRGQDRGWLEVAPDHIAFLTSANKAGANVLYVAVLSALSPILWLLSESSQWVLFSIVGIGLLVAVPLLHRASRYTEEVPKDAEPDLWFPCGHVQTVTLQLPRHETLRGTSQPLEVWARGERHRFDLLMKASDIRALGDHLAAWYPTDVAIMPPLSVKGMA